MQLLVTSRTLRSRSKAYTCHSRVHSEEDAHQPPAVTRWPSLNWALVPGPFFSTLPTPAAELHNTHEKQCVDEPPEGCKGLLNAQHLSWHQRVSIHVRGKLADVAGRPGRKGAAAHPRNLQTADHLACHSPVFCCCTACKCERQPLSLKQCCVSSQPPRTPLTSSAVNHQARTGTWGSTPACHTCKETQASRDTAS